MISQDAKLLAVHDKLEKKIKTLQLKHGINGKDGDMYDELERQIRNLHIKHGIDGKDGIDGVDGASIQGDQGYQGDTGDQGDKGDTGVQGDTGYRGYQGHKGDKGDTGERGDDGIDGTSVLEVELDFDNHLVVHLTDGTQIDAGPIEIGINGDQYFRSGTKVSVTSGESTIKGSVLVDFGEGLSTVSTVVFDPRISNTHQIGVEMSTLPTSDHPLEDLLYDPIRVAAYNIIGGIGFSVIAQMDNAVANGTYNINWFAR